METSSATRVLLLIALVCLIALLACLCALALSLRATAVSLPAQIAGFTSAVFGEAQQARAGLVSAPDRIAAPVMAQISRIADGDPKGKTELERAPLRSLVLSEIHGQAEFLRMDGMQIAGAALTEIDQAREDLTAQLTALNYTAHSAVVHANGLMDTYSDLPGQLVQSPAWLAIEPEITCRHADGTGYGGCWHSRITGLFGEAEKVGGVFTQKFPSLADSVTGIAADAHGWTAKYVQPHPMHTGDYFKAAGKITLGLGVAGLRGGVF